MSAHSKFVPDPAWPTIVELAIERWGQPNKELSSRDDIRFGSNGSKSVKPSSPHLERYVVRPRRRLVERWRLARRGASLTPRRIVAKAEAG